MKTYLERDVQDLAAISALPDLLRLMRAACLRTGQLGVVVRLDSGWHYLRTPAPVRSIEFVYRQSPVPMVPGGREGILFPDDPPLTSPGDVSVRRLPDGRLVELAIAPPRSRPSSPDRQADFSPLLSDAGLDPRTLRAVPPEWTAPVDTDAKQAWIDTPPERRIEAASYHGAPVWFPVFDVAEQPQRVPPDVGARAARIEEAAFIAFMIVAGVRRAGTHRPLAVVEDTHRLEPPPRRPLA